VPFAGTSPSAAGEPGALPEAFTLQETVTHCLGSQAWSPRYRQQIATAMLDEPLASETTTTVTLADGTTASARVCSIPIDFAGLGLNSTV
jgi:glycine cleavage system aminomethyltransferase T